MLTLCYSIISHATLIPFLLCIHANTTKLLNTKCTLVATSMILRSLECARFYTSGSALHILYKPYISYLGLLNFRSSHNCHIYIVRFQWTMYRGLEIKYEALVFRVLICVCVREKEICPFTWGSKSHSC